MKGSRPLDKSETRQLKTLFRGRWGKRNLALFYLGVNTGYRITELLSITIGDIVDQSGNFKDYLMVSRSHMKRKHESRAVPLNGAAQTALVPWLRELAKEGYTHRDDFLFQSQRAGNRAISASQAWRVLTAAYRLAGMSGTLGTHAMRKTFANNMYQHFLARQANGEQVDAFRCTSKALGHKNVDSTDQYLSFNYNDIYMAINAVEV